MCNKSRDGNDVWKKEDIKEDDEGKEQIVINPDSLVSDGGMSE